MGIRRSGAIFVRWFASYLIEKKIGSTKGWHKPSAYKVRFTPRSEVECISCSVAFEDDLNMCSNCGTLREPVQQCDTCSNVFMAKCSEVAS